MRKLTIVLLAVSLLLSTAAPAVPTAAAAGSTYEFENGTIYDMGDNATAAVTLTGASGGRAVDLRDAGDSVTLNVSADKGGLYTLRIRYSQPYDEAGKYQNVLVNGTNVGQILCAYTGDGGFRTADISTSLKTGSNSITIEGSWGWTYLDSMTLEEGTSVGNSISGRLSNPNASAETQSLYSFLCDTYGSYVIAGQQESTWMGSENYEFDIIRDASGRYPALRGLDYMGDDFAGCNRRAKAWFEQGGIVTICWHCGSDFSGSHTESLNTDLSWDSALTPGTTEYNNLIAGMDKAAAALKELQDAGIPVIWRPFHEFDGKWFWWGKGGPENFKKLWRIMYDRYTNHWGLDNLIWSLGYCGDVNDGWYPGDEYVDIIGADTYVDHNNSLVSMYQKTAQVAGKPVCLHENGPIPDPDKQQADGASWLWFMTWHTSFIDSNAINTTDYLNKVYNSAYTLTLDELPDVYHYQSAVPDAPELVKGDVNGDGSFTVVDAVMMQKFLLGAGGLTAPQSGELCTDGVLNAFDLAAMKRLLLHPPAAEAPATSLTPEAYTAKVQPLLTEYAADGITDEKSGVQYGTMTRYEYYSTTRARMTGVNVLLPPDYTTDKQYPVLYALHGYWDDESTLLEYSDARTMAGNLMASGEAEEMIIVFPYIYTSKTEPYCTGMDLANSLNYDNFINDLVNDLMPWMSQNFSIRTGRENTAITGFSMGARESLFIGLTRSDLFGYVGSACTAPGLPPGWDTNIHPGQLQEGELRPFYETPQLILITAGGYDSVVQDNPSAYEQMLTHNGVPHLFHYVPNGGHDSSSIQPHFYNFLRSIFKAF